MKKKLFVLVVTASLYTLFILAFTALDNQGKVSKFFSEIGLSNATAMASTTDIQLPQESDLKLKSSLRKPAPKPRKPKPTELI